MKSTEIEKTDNPGARFLYNMSLAGTEQSGVEDPERIVLFYESRPWDDGKRVVAFADAHVKIVDEGTWTKLSGTLHLKLPKKGKPMKPDQKVPNP